MQDAIEQIMETEKAAADIVNLAEKKSADLISENDVIIAEKLNKFREFEQTRYSKAVSEAEMRMNEAIERVRTEKLSVEANVEVISDKVLNRMMKTVFD